MQKKVYINNIEIGRNSKPYIIAEMSANHNGSLNKAKEIITSAKKNGADAIKIQTYTADTMTIKSNKDDFQIFDGLWKGYSLYDLYKWAETPFEWQKSLFEYAKKEEITLFSTPFDETAIDLLEDLNSPAYKIASFEATDLPLIKYAASTKKPLIVSTGLLNLSEIEEVYNTVLDSKCDQLILLHCISSYPAPIDESNLLTIRSLREKFDIPIGLSDHTLSNTTSLAATALGASVIEKHFIVDKNDKGPDSEFSINPIELKSLCDETKNVWKALGSVNYDLKDAEKDSLKYRRSIYFVKDIQKGDTITEQHIKRIRPGYGLSGKYYKDLIGKKVNKSIKSGTPTSFEVIK